MSIQPKSKVPSPSVHECPVCHHPQTKIQRRLSGKANGSTIYVCARAGECSVGMNLSKVDTWVAV
jgi:ssDNA-binding Zn-finger/Zn-ribbon topoisomerase 1